MHQAHAKANFSTQNLQEHQAAPFSSQTQSSKVRLHVKLEGFFYFFQWFNKLGSLALPFLFTCYYSNCNIPVTVSAIPKLVQAFNTSFSAPWRWAWFIWCGIPYVHHHQYNLIPSSICFVSDCSTLTCHNLLYRTPTWDTESLTHCMRIDNGFAFLGGTYAQHVPHACFQ